MYSVRVLHGRVKNQLCVSSDNRTLVTGLVLADTVLIVLVDSFPNTHKNLKKNFSRGFLTKTHSEKF